MNTRVSSAATSLPPDYPSPAAALRDLAGTDSPLRERASMALCSRWKPLPLKDTIEGAWRELGERGQQLVPDLVRTMVAEKDCLPVLIAARALGLQGEDGLTELIVLTRHGDWAVRWCAYCGFELAGPSARVAVPTLIRRLPTEHQPLSIDAILRSLGTIGGKDAIAYLPPACDGVDGGRTVRGERADDDAARHPRDDASVRKAAGPGRERPRPRQHHACSGQLDAESHGLSHGGGMVVRLSRYARGGIRTPDTRIMIPLL
jgi:hypothetical protein